MTSISSRNAIVRLFLLAIRYDACAELLGSPATVAAADSAATVIWLRGALCRILAL